MALKERWQISDDEARRFAGKWVAIRDGKVVFANADPGPVVEWARRQDHEPDLVIALPKPDDPKVWVL